MSLSHDQHTIPGPEASGGGSLASQAPGPDFLLLEVKVAGPFERLAELLARLWFRESLWDMSIVPDEGLVFFLKIKAGALRESLPLRLELDDSFLADSPPNIETEGETEEKAADGSGTEKDPLDSLYASLRQVLKARRPADGEGFRLDVSLAEKIAWPQAPLAVGPWTLMEIADPGQSPPLRPDRIFIPPVPFSPKFWQGQNIAALSVSDWLNPPPGAPDTRGGKALFLSDFPPLGPLCALAAGAGEIHLVTDDEKTAADFFQLNQKSRAVKILGSFSQALKQKTLSEEYSFMAFSLSPYAVSRRLKVLAERLAEDGRILITDLAPGSQTAYILRAAAKYGLLLASSHIALVAGGLWAAMILERAPHRETLPPLSFEAAPELEGPPEAPAELPDLSALGLDLEEGEEDPEESERKKLLEDEEKTLLELEEDD